MNIVINADAAGLIPSAQQKEMLSVRNEGGKYFVKINSSSLSIMQECWRKTDLSLNQNYRSNMESPATLFGSAIHKALEIFYAGSFGERTLPRDFVKMSELLSFGADVPEAGDFLVLRAIAAFVEKAQPLSGLTDESSRSISNGVWILTEYFKKYIDDPFVVLIDEKGPIIERMVEYELYDSPTLHITYFGTIDVVLQNARTGTVLVTDHKTSSVVGQPFFNRLKPNHQYTGYLWGAQKCLGLETDSFLVNCVEVKAKPKTARGTPPSFPRQVTTRSPEDMIEFQDTVVTAVRDYLTRLETGMWPLGHTSACAAYAGCQYLEVCSSPQTIRENILKTRYSTPTPTQGHDDGATF